MDHTVEECIVIRMNKEEARALNAIFSNFTPMKGAFPTRSLEVLDYLKDILSAYEE